MNPEFLSRLLLLLIVNMVGDGIHDLSVVQVEEEGEILLSFVYQVLDALIECADKPKIRLVLILEVRENLPSGLPTLHIDRDNLLLIQNIECLSKEGEQTSFT